MEGKGETSVKEREKRTQRKAREVEKKGETSVNKRERDAKAWEVEKNREKNGDREERERRKRRETGVRLWLGQVSPSLTIYHSP